VISIGGILMALSALGRRRQSSPPSVSLDEYAALDDQCLQLRTELERQKNFICEDIRDATFDQLQSLLVSYPTVRKLAQENPNLPAKNVTALFTPLENFVKTWGYAPIGSPWEQVAYDPQRHQADTEDIDRGEPVYVRFVGYRQGDRIVCPAKVSRTLPQMTT
jgi:molecular chaperone GrpE (heat shock protein)